MTDKVAVVTGAGGGIGAAVCRRFAEEGCAVVAADTNEALLDELTDGEIAGGGSIIGVVTDVSYDAVGCSISQASASVLTDLVIGKPVDEAMSIHEEFLTLMQGKGTVEPDEDVLEDGIAFAGVAKFPARVKCALLSWMAWKDATAQSLEGSN